MATVNFSVMLTQAERAKLQRIADESGRKPGEVVRRLLVLADLLPEARRLLGDPVSEPRGKAPQEFHQ